MPKQLTTTDFINKSKLVHKDRYIYTDTQYVNKYVKVAIECRLHGIFSVFPQSHYKGANCPKCAKKTEIRTKGLVFTGTGKHTGKATFKAFSKKFNTEFYRKFVEVHGNTYKYNTQYYSKCKEINKVPIRCVKHGIFWMTPKAHVEGQGCPSCANYGFKKNKPAILYYLSINNGEAYKIGVTNNSIKIRFSATELKTITVIKTVRYEIGEEAYKMEQKILKRYVKYKYTGSPLLVNGNTELFNKDILRLDKQTASAVP